MLSGVFMNYLAHIFLSGDDRLVQIGNFVGDAVKGKAYLRFPPQMQKGILLHRRIDSFADTHPLVREAVSLGREPFGRYAAVVMDLFFDYFLAKHFREYATCSLSSFARRFYWGLVIHYPWLPGRFKYFIWHFIITNRLGCYASPEGIRRSLEIMVAYRGLKIEPGGAIDFLLANEARLQALFSLFFPEIQEMCQRELARPTTWILNS